MTKNGVAMAEAAAADWVVFNTVEELLEAVDEDELWLFSTAAVVADIS